MVLKKDEVAQAERGEKNALNGVWIAGGVFALFVILLLVLKKKKKRELNIDMELVISILILFILVNCLLKLSFWKGWQAAFCSD